MNNRTYQIVKALLNARSNIMVGMETKMWFTYVKKRDIRDHIRLGYTIVKPPRDYIDAYGNLLWIVHRESV